MLEYRTEGYNGYAVKYSPFYDSRIAVAASSNFGLVGNGRLFILGLTAQGIVPVKSYDTQDALYDTAWSEAHENQIVVSCGDGSVKLYDLTVNDFPIQSFKEHNREVFSVFWNLVAKDTFASSSWDGTIKIWSPTRAASILTLPTHSCTYSTAFSPHSPSILSSVSSDSHLRIFDLRTPASASNHLISSTPIHGALQSSGPHSIGSNRNSMPPSECLTHDWNKYRNGVIATGSVDGRIRTFDQRMLNGPSSVLQGHTYAVRRLAWSPHLSDVLLSASYDMTCKIWQDGSGSGNNTANVEGEATMAMGGMGGMGGVLLGSMSRHTEFVTGVDWCLFGAEGWCASVGWDERLLVWDVKAVVDASR